MTDALLECVPNFSEGRNQTIIHALESSLNVPLLDSTSDRDHNRSVLTFAAAPAQVEDAAFRVIQAAAEWIDITKHTGAHPRTGATDVVPFVPLRHSTLTECAATAHRLGARVWRELEIPVYFYEAAATRPECLRLENIRRNNRTITPDLGTSPHPTAGVCIIGARKILIAWNINLRSTDIAAACTIASEIRESNGGLPAVKARGFSLPERNQVQVSMNLVDYERTPLHAAFDRVAALCRAHDIEIDGSELIGLIPQAALDQSAGHDLQWLNLTPRRVIENRLPPDGPR